MQSPVLTRLIDHACGPLAERIEQSSMPGRMRVHRSVFECVEAIRAREITDGYPLMFLGMELVASENVPVDGFEFVD
jgi:hypothetical protein